MLKHLHLLVLLTCLNVFFKTGRCDFNRSRASFQESESCHYYGKEHGLFLPGTPSPRVIVTGGAGFIGSHLVKELSKGLADGQVKVVDNLWRGDLRNLQDDDGAWAINVTNDFCLLDLRDAARTDKFIRGADVVFHLADIVAGVEYVFDQEAVFSDNMLININTITSAKQNGVRDFLYVGTACSFPQHLQMGPGVHALRENRTYPAEPESAYGWSKLMGEYQAELSKTDKFRVGILRLHNVYGPRTEYSAVSGQAIPSLIRKALRYPEEEFIVWGSGKQFRDFIFVDDVVEALFLLHERGLNQGVIQVGNGEATTIASLAETVMHVSQHYRKDSLHMTFDTSKPEGDRGHIAILDRAHEILGWQARVSLTHGIDATMKWMKRDMLESKILVILIGQPRGGGMAWKSLQKHLLNPLGAHLALMFTDAMDPTVLNEYAQYVWNIPEYDDWGEILDNAASQCSPDSARVPWRELCQVPGVSDGNGQFLGGVCNHPASADILLAMRWLLQQKIKEYNLGNKYDWFVLSRADELYTCDHVPIKGFDPAFAWLPEGEHYDGWSDRHAVGSSEIFPKMINITTELVCNAHIWLPQLLAAKNSTWKFNLERIQKHIWDKTGVKVKEFKRSMFTVKMESDPTRWSKGYEHHLLSEYGLKVKYPESMKVAVEHCPGAHDALRALHDELKKHVVSPPRE